MGKSRHDKGVAIAHNWDYWHHTWEVNSKGDPLGPLRDKLCAHLQQLTGSAKVAGPESTMAGCVECFGLACVEEIGLIQVGRSPIRWVNAVMDGNEYLWGQIDYGIPDQRQLPIFGMRAEGVRSFPVFGPMVDLRWNATSGGDVARRIAASLAGNRELTLAFLATRSLDDDLVINTCTEHNMWWIGTLWQDPDHPVSPEKWACYEMIAKHLLALPLR